MLMIRNTPGPWAGFTTHVLFLIVVVFQVSVHHSRTLPAASVKLSSIYRTELAAVVTEESSTYMSASTLSNTTRGQSLIHRINNKVSMERSSRNINRDDPVGLYTKVHLPGRCVM